MGRLSRRGTSSTNRGCCDRSGWGRALPAVRLRWQKSKLKCRLSRHPKGHGSRLEAGSGILPEGAIFRSARYVLLAMENHDTGNKGSTDVLMVEKVSTKSLVTPDLSA